MVTAFVRNSHVGLRHRRYLDNNAIASIPNEMGNMRGLEELSAVLLPALPFSSVALQSLSSVVGTLHSWLFSNKIEELPESLGKLHSLKKLSVFCHVEETAPLSRSSGPDI